MIFKLIFIFECLSKEKFKLVKCNGKHLLLWLAKKLYLKLTKSVVKIKKNFWQKAASSFQAIKQLNSFLCLARYCHTIMNTCSMCICQIAVTTLWHLATVRIAFISLLYFRMVFLPSQCFSLLFFSHNYYKPIKILKSVNIKNNNLVFYHMALLYFQDKNSRTTNRVQIPRMWGA